MEEDNESQKIKSLEDFKKEVLKLQKEVKSLKRKISKINDIITIFNNLDFPKQLGNQSDEIKQLHDSLLLTKRWLAKFEMNSHQAHICREINNQLPDQTKGILIQKVKIRYAGMAAAINTSNEPLTLAGDFKAECMKISEDYKLNAYF